MAMASPVRSTKQNRKCARRSVCSANPRGTGRTATEATCRLGDIPATVLRRDQPHEAPPHRGVAAPPPPTTSRLQRTEAALAAETAARDKAERLLAETQNVMRDLRTKIGHAELAKNEAVEALRHERDSIGQFRTEIEALRQQLEEAHAQVQAAERHAHTVQEHLTEERQARRVAEKALRASETALETAEQLVRTLSEEKPAPRRVAEPPPRRAPVMREPEVVAAPVKRARVAPAAAAVPATVTSRAGATAVATRPATAAIECASSDPTLYARSVRPRAKMRHSQIVMSAA